MSSTGVLPPFTTQNTMNRALIVAWHVSEGGVAKNCDHSSLSWTSEEENKTKNQPRYFVSRFEGANTGQRKI